MSGFASWRIGMATAILLVSADGAWADGKIDQEILPPSNALTCSGSCEQIEPARLVTSSQAEYPFGVARSGAEGVVVLSATIGVDGRAHDILVERLVGSKECAEVAKKALADEAFQPAMLAGKPVSANIRERVTFQLPNSNGSRRPLFDLYRHIRSMSDQGDTRGAVDLLRTTLLRNDLNLYERSMFAYSFATMLAAQNRMTEALDAIRDATIEGGRFLDDASFQPALRLRVRLEAQAGNFAAALAAYDVLSKRVFLPTTDETSEFVSKLRGLINGVQPLPAAGKTEAQDIPWHLTLVRRTFAFGAIHGTLASFDLRCGAHALSSPVNETSEWTVPAGWSDCHVYVRGDPGAMFQLVELPPRTADAVGKRN